MKIVFALLLFVGLFGVGAGEVFACRCAPPKTARLALKKAAVVFSGTVVDLVIDNNTNTYKATFSVEKVWKGVTTKEVMVVGGTVCCVCDYEFKKGTSYLVFGGYDKESNTISTSTCTRTQELATASAFVKALGKGSVPAN